MRCRAARSRRAGECALQPEHGRAAGAERERRQLTRTDRARRLPADVARAPDGAGRRAVTEQASSSSGRRGSGRRAPMRTLRHAVALGDRQRSRRCAGRSAPRGRAVRQFGGSRAATRRCAAAPARRPGRDLTGSPASSRACATKTRYCLAVNAREKVPRPSVVVLARNVTRPPVPRVDADGLVRDCGLDGAGELDARAVGRRVSDPRAASRRRPRPRAPARSRRSRPGGRRPAATRRTVRLAGVPSYPGGRSSSSRTAATPRASSSSAAIRKPLRTAHAVPRRDSVLLVACEAPNPRLRLLDFDVDPVGGEQLPELSGSSRGNRVEHDRPLSRHVVRIVAAEASIHNR